MIFAEDVHFSTYDYEETVGSAGTASMMALYGEGMSNTTHPEHFDSEGDS